MAQIRIIDEYFVWLKSLAYGEHFATGRSFDELLALLHRIEFTYSIPMDQNRAEDGISLRYRYAITTDCPYSVDEVLYEIDGPCSVLEMMLALAIRCEEDIMDDPGLGDRIKQWFWGMIVNLNLGGLHDGNFDQRHVEQVILRLLNRDYEPNGRGGLFTVRHPIRDLRDVEIWTQLLWYLDDIT